MMNLTEKKLSSRTVYDGKILKLSVDEVQLPDGTESVRECVRHCGGAAVLLVLNGKVALVKQHRYLYGKDIYEIPAGKLESGEEPSAGAARECSEETGYRAEVEKLLKIYPSPGYTDEVIHVFLAKNAQFVGQHVDDGEFLTCEFIPLEKVVEMIEKGEICDAKTVAAVYKYLSMKK
ncbi:MAG: NUDIX hydrolase [Clostridia bacterium]|nr:NUDIX hydrolase [Clostridia bacterium]MDE7084983.1 NUDIX hydrolase [Clostridia bacterium]